MSSLELAIIAAVVTFVTLISTTLLHVRIRSSCCSMSPDTVPPDNNEQTLEELDLTGRLEELKEDLGRSTELDSESE